MGRHLTRSTIIVAKQETMSDQIEKEAERQGMLKMKQDGILKVLEGVTSLEEVLRVAEEK